MMAVTNPREPTCYWTTYRSEHACVEPPRPSQRCLGKPTLWHQHDIVTGKHSRYAYTNTSTHSTRALSHTYTLGKEQLVCVLQGKREARVFL